jgi:hypothetical protein
MNASSMNGMGATSSGNGVPMGVPGMGGQPMAMVPTNQGMPAQGKPGAPNQNVLDAVKKVGISLILPALFRVK